MLDRRALDYPLFVSFGEQEPVYLVSWFDLVAMTRVDCVTIDDDN